MGRVADILLRARDKINDPDATRWSDDQLLRILNEGQRDLASHVKMFRDSTHIPLIAGQNIYQLPDSLITILRVSYEGRKLPLKSHYEMDNPPIEITRHNTSPYQTFNQVDFDDVQKSDWLEDTTEKDITAIVYDKLNRNTIQVYPRPLGPFVESVDDVSLYGLTTEVIEDGNFVTGSSYNILTDLVDDNTTVVDPSTYNNQTVSALLIYYTKLPDNILLANIATADPALSPQWDKALHCYVAGNALKEDVKELNRKMGEAELKYYFRELAKAEELQTENFIESMEDRQTHYDGMGR